MARVLIVDDTEIMRRALELAVKSLGHMAETAADGAEALKLATAHPPDLAVVDFRMPVMDGAELYGALRAQLGPRCPRILMISATPSEEVASRVAREGPPVPIVRKPFHLEDLARAVEQALDRAA